MFRRNVKKLVLGSLVAGFAWTMTAPQADAFWHHRRWGSSGGWYSSGGSSGHYSSGGSWGSSGGWYSSGGSSGHSSGGSWGSSGGSSGHYSSGGSWGSSGGSSGGHGHSVHSVPAMPATPPGGTVVPDGSPSAEPPSLDPPMPGTTRYTPARSATLTVSVPAEARVFVNGMQTRSTGSERRYVSNGLRPGFNYTYELRAEVERDGQIVEETKVVQLQAGQTAEVNFGFDGDAAADERTASKPTKTSLTLNVPADAKVYLSGNESKSTGPVRQFTTTKLNPGQSWDNYVVRVEFNRNGQTVTKEETITLSAGETREMTIGDATEVAQASTEAGRQ